MVTNKSVATQRVDVGQLAEAVSLELTVHEWGNPCSLEDPLVPVQRSCEREARPRGPNGTSSGESAPHPDAGCVPAGSQDPRSAPGLARVGDVVKHGWQVAKAVAGAAFLASSVEDLDEAGVLRTAVAQERRQALSSPMSGRVRPCPLGCEA